MCFAVKKTSPMNGVQVVFQFRNERYQIIRKDAFGLKCVTDTDGYHPCQYLVMLIIYPQPTAKVNILNRKTSVDYNFSHQPGYQLAKSEKNIFQKYYVFCICRLQLVLKCPIVTYQSCIYRNTMNILYAQLLV